MCGWGGGGGHFLHSAVLLLHARGMVLRRSNYKCAYMYTSVCCEFFYMCPECACSCTILEPWLAVSVYHAHVHIFSIWLSLFCFREGMVC